MGWIAGNRELISALAKIKSQFDSGLSLPLQKLGAYVLNNFDNIDDFKVIERVFEELKHIPNFDMQDVTNLFKLKPEIMLINKGSVINEGYIKSIKNEMFIDENLNNKTNK